MLPVFVLSMNPTRLRQTLDALSARGSFEVEHVPAVDGRDPSLRSDPELTAFARHLCPDKTLAIALSHRSIAQRFLETSAASWCLVLEDDAVPLEDGGDLQQTLLACADRHAGRDYVRLYCQGACRSDASLLQGSTAAYLLSRQGARKLRVMPLFWHVDVQLNAPHFRGGLCPLFRTRDAGTSLLTREGWRFWAAQPYLRAPGFGKTISAGAFYAAVGVSTVVTSASCGPLSHACACSMALLLCLPLFAQLVTPAQLTADAAAAACAVAALALASSARWPALRPAAWLVAWLAVLCALSVPRRRAAVDEVR